jgi:hypothetical protein
MRLFSEYVLIGGMPAAVSASLKRDRVMEKLVAASAVGQSILANNASQNSLYYWLSDGKSVNAEVDYVIQCETFLTPVEVKSGVSGSLKSLHQFVAERELKHAVRFDLNPPSTQHICVQALVSGGKTKPPTTHFTTCPSTAPTSFSSSRQGALLQTLERDRRAASPFASVLILCLPCLKKSGGYFLLTNALWKTTKPKQEANHTQEMDVILFPSKSPLKKPKVRHIRVDDPLSVFLKPTDALRSGV